MALKDTEIARSGQAPISPAGGLPWPWTAAKSDAAASDFGRSGEEHATPRGAFADAFALSAWFLLVWPLRMGYSERMQRTLAILFVIASGFMAASSRAEITTGNLLEEMADLGRLAQWPEPGYRTIQFSSYDRRSTSSEAPGWFSNADGFGHEPQPGFLKVLREPKDGQPGLYLVAEVAGPGCIVRGWSAGMGGKLKVQLDPAAGDDSPAVWDGSAYEFLARRSGNYFKRAGLAIEAGDAFTQEDADYLPLPFAKGLRVTWEGALAELHFYHLQVRLYPPGTAVRTFDPARDLRDFEPQLRTCVASLTQPTAGGAEGLVKFAGTIKPSESWTWSPEGKGSGAIRELKLRLQDGHSDAAWRSCLLRISFDGSQRPQVEAPVGDFFGSGHGVNPFSSLPMTVEPNGWMTCRFVMPYEKSVKVEIVNYSGAAVQVDGAARVSAWEWNDRSLYFRAKWRVDHDLLAGAGALDLPFTVTIGKGVFVGCAAMIMNPSGVPTAGGNWWGEGDEKFLVDGELTPSTFGTGSEDYFNYAWSRCTLFAHPYCGQPLDSGPDTAGYVSNHRFQITDAIPFERSMAALIELWAHRPTPGLSYARIAYHYARPGAVDDHRALMPSDLKLPVLPKRMPEAAGGAEGATIHLAAKLGAQATSGAVETVPCAIATQLELVQWHAEKGAELKLRVPIAKAGRTTLHLVALHSPEGATLQATIGGKALVVGDKESIVSLRSPHAQRVLNVAFLALDLPAGEQELVLKCVEPGVVGLDYCWIISR